jgi:hypothetical protein
MVPRRAKKPQRVKLARVSSPVNLDGFLDSELQSSFPSPVLHFM